MIPASLNSTQLPSTIEAPTLPIESRFGARPPANQTPVMRSFAVPASHRTAWPSHAPVTPYSASIIVDGDYPFDRKTLERSGILPTTPYSILYLSELPGDNAIERGQALLKEIRHRKETGEFSTSIPPLIFVHGTVRNGELLLGDGDGRIVIPATVLLHELNKLSDRVTPSTPLSPVVLSACKAAEVAEALKDSPRPVLINADEELLMASDAEAMLRASVRIAEQSWTERQILSAEQWFDKLSAVSGETLHLVGCGEWIVHDPMTSVTSMDDISLDQAGLILRKKISRGSVDDLAEALLLFGTEPLLHGSYDELPVMHFLYEENPSELNAMLTLLAALGVSLDQQNEEGNTLLHRLCTDALSQLDPEDSKYFDDTIEMIRLLMSNGANPDISNGEKLTARSMVLASRNRELIAAFHPQLAELDYPTLGPDGLRIAAKKHGWKCVLSLLDEAAQAMDVDDDETDRSDSSQSEVSTGGSQRTVPDARPGMNEHEYLAATALMALDNDLV